MDGTMKENISIAAFGMSDAQIEKHKPTAVANLSLVLRRLHEESKLKKASEASSKQAS